MSYLVMEDTDYLYQSERKEKTLKDLTAISPLIYSPKRRMCTCNRPPEQLILTLFKGVLHL